jgi:hypothetical protein
MTAYMPINLRTNDKNWNFQNLDSLKCNQDLNHALDISTKEFFKKNVKKIHQISLENNFIIHEVREMQDSSNVQS